jgi:outer membrane receptor protein involved in Fe transport
MISSTQLRTCAGLFVRCVLLFVAFGLAPRPAAAQDTGTVQGTVLDDAGTPIPGTQVAVVGTTRGTTSDADGRYRITGLPTGEQTLRASFVGYRSQTVTVTIRPGQTIQQDFTLVGDLLMMEEAVVTGAFNPRAKLESSVAITTLGAEEIETQAPQNTADLLKAVPGFYVESSGGEGGNNVFARGIPADGSYRYVSMQADGMPVFESPELAFTNVDLLYRLDETVERMEAVRGGSASVFSSNAPGGIVNFVSKTGGDELEGLVKFTGGSSGLFRGDFNLGGPLAENWRFNAGGFYRTDDGVRFAGFTGNKGGQFRANVTRLLGDDGDLGYLRVFGTYLNDRNIFYLPVPLQDPNDPRSIDGFDAQYGTLTSLNAALVQVPGPNGFDRELDLTDGMHPTRHSLKTDLLFNLGDGLTLRNTSQVMSADVSFNAIFSLNEPTSAVEFAEAALRRYNQSGAGPLASGYDYGIAFDDDVETLDFDPTTANGNGLVVESGWWNVEKPLTNIANNLQVSYETDRHALSGGVYFSYYSVSEQWQFNNILSEVRSQPRLLDLDLVDENGAPIVGVTQNGFTRYGDFHRRHEGEGTVIALYAGDEWTVSDVLRIDAGARYEKGVFRGKTEINGEGIDLGDPTTLADDNFVTGTGRFRPYDHAFDEWAASLGVNVRINPQLAVFGRGSRGFRMPDFDQWGATPLVKGASEEIWQAEAGLKYASSNVAVFASGFFSTLTDIPFVDEVVVDGQTVTATRTADSQTIGLETEVTARYRTLQASLTATLQNPEYTGLRFENEALSEFEVLDFDGNRVRRIPRYIVEFRPSYTIGPARLFGAVRYMDERFSDDANNVTLPDYWVFNAGASVNVRNVTVRATGNNLANTIGLTEGNPRVGQVVGVERDIFMARPILGRSGQLSIAYTF